MPTTLDETTQPKSTAPTRGSRPATGDSSMGSFFKPKTVAVIGSSERPGSVGRALLENLGTFGGAVYPVNREHDTILGRKAYRDIASVPAPVELAVIATPAVTVPGVIRECVKAGVKAAIIISAGFKESGATGTELEGQVLAAIQGTPLRVIGPNCLGVMAPHAGLNATFSKDMAKTGNVAFLTQSGALGTAIIDWSLKEKVGFSAFVSIGSMLDIGWGDLIRYLGDDPQTHSIMIYMESVGDAPAFLAAVREVAPVKPIVVIKVGRTDAAAKAAASHTGALTGSDEVLDAAFNRAGVIRVETIEEFFSMAKVLAKQPLPRGPRLCIVTNAGGPGVLATDMLVERGAQLATLSPQTITELNKVLPQHWSHANPIDILGDADAPRYAAAVAVAARDPGADGVLVILTPQAMTDPIATADLMRTYARMEGKPLLTSWMGGTRAKTGRVILSEAGIPMFDYPDDAARAFANMWRYSKSLQPREEVSAGVVQSAPFWDAKAAEARVSALIGSIRKRGGTLLTEYESKRVLSDYGIPTVETQLAVTQAEAIAAAGSIGFPVVIKLHSDTITHKTDVGGVKLNIRDAAGVRGAWEAIEAAVKAKHGPGHFQGVTVQPMVMLKGCELILGSSLDPQFGPVLLFGAGGVLVEVFKDRALGLPPLDPYLARRLMEQTKIFKVLKGVRGRSSVDLAALDQILVRFSQLVAEQRWIKEIDINPLLASPERILALDARIVLHGPEVREEDIPALAATL
ncbi:MAG: acetate--CoA ligase family protein [Opitutaceae bacterium]